MVILTTQGNSHQDVWAQMQAAKVSPNASPQLGARNFGGRGRLMSKPAMSSTMSSTMSASTTNSSRDSARSASSSVPRYGSQASTCDASHPRSSVLSASAPPSEIDHFASANNAGNSGHSGNKNGGTSSKFFIPPPEKVQKLHSKLEQIEENLVASGHAQKQWSAYNNFFYGQQVLPERQFSLQEFTRVDRATARLEKQVFKLKKDIFKVMCRGQERRLESDVADLLSRLHFNQPESAQDYWYVVWCDSGNDEFVTCSGNTGKTHYASWANEVPMLPTASLLPNGRRSALQRCNSPNFHKQDYRAHMRFEACTTCGNADLDPKVCFLRGCNDCMDLAVKNFVTPPGDEVIALHFAAFRGRMQTLLALQLDGVDVHTKGLNGFTALHWACYGGQVAAASLLLDQGAAADLHVADYVGMYPLHWAAYHGHSDLLPELFCSLADVNARVARSTKRNKRFFDGWTALDIAIFAQNDETAFLLKTIYGAEHSREFLSDARNLSA